MKVGVIALTLLVMLSMTAPMASASVSTENGTISHACTLVVAEWICDYSNAWCKVGVAEWICDSILLMST